MRVVAEIDGEGSFLVPDEALQRLAELCAGLQAAIEQPDDEQLSRMLADVLSYVRAAGPAVPASASSSARLLLPRPGASRAEIETLGPYAMTGVVTSVADPASRPAPSVQPGTRPAGGRDWDDDLLRWESELLTSPGRDRLRPDTPNARQAGPDAAPGVLTPRPGFEERLRHSLGRPGRLMFNPPARMLLGETRRVEVRVAGALDIDEELMADLRGPGASRLEQIPTAPLMAVTLGGAGFTIESCSDEEQSVAADAVTTWEYDIQARKRGEQRLIMSVRLRIPVRGRPAQRRSIPVREAVIDVQVRAPAVVGRFIAANWQWLTGTLIAVAAVVAAVLFH
jgi:PspAA-like protein